MKAFLILIALVTSTAALSATDYDKKLKSYVQKRLYNRTANGQIAASAQEMVNEIAKTRMTLDENSLRCIGAPSPAGDGKAIGVCLISGYDAFSGGDHLEQTYVISISADIEHGDVSRIWDVRLQQSIYF